MDDTTLHSFVNELLQNTQRLTRTAKELWELMQEEKKVTSDGAEVLGMVPGPLWDQAEKNTMDMSNMEGPTSESAEMREAVQQVARSQEIAHARCKELLNEAQFLERRAEELRKVAHVWEKFASH